MQENVHVADTYILFILYHNRNTNLFCLPSLSLSTLCVFIFHPLRTLSETRDVFKTKQKSIPQLQVKSLILSFGRIDEFLLNAPSLSHITFALSWHYTVLQPALVHFWSFIAFYAAILSHYSLSQSMTCRHLMVSSHGKHSWVSLCLPGGRCGGQHAGLQVIRLKTHTLTWAN